MVDEHTLPLRAMARRLGVTQTWLREQSDAGLIPHLRAGRRYLFAPCAVERAVARLAATCPTADDCDADHRNSASGGV